jgi:DNA-binding CsgD family transcriptional regulator
MRVTANTGALEHARVQQDVVFHRPAELVDVSERIYRQVFAVGLWVAAGLGAFAAVSSLLQPDAGSQLRGFMVCAAFAVVCVASGVSPAPVYRNLRRRPWLLLGVGVVLGAGSWLVGMYNFQLLMTLIALIGVAGIATPRSVVIASAVVAGVGLGVPHLVDGDGNLGGPLAVIVPPLLFWLIVDRIAGFALRLHQSLSEHEQPAQRPGPERAGGPNVAPEASAHSEPPGSQRSLPTPQINEIDGVRLTGRQLQVVLLVCEGLRHDEIAACLEIGVPMVRRHLEKARKRVGAGSTPEVVAWAFAVELVPHVNR